jgi:hypothetical protein
VELNPERAEVIGSEDVVLAKLLAVTLLNVGVNVNVPLLESDELHGILT